MLDRLKIAHLNTRSLIAHFDDVTQLLHRESIDILCLTETWLNESMPDGNVAISDYCLFREDRTDGRRGGGLMVYIRNNLRISVSRFDVNKSCDFEYMFLKLSFSGKSCILGLIYRPPNYGLNNCIEQIDDLLSQLIPTSDYFMLLGDVNINMFDPTNSLHSCCSSYGLTQVIADPTRISRFSESLPDPIFMSFPENKLDSGTVDVHFSDHRLAYVIVNLKVPRFRQKFVTVRNFKYFNYNEFLNDLLGLTWHDFYRAETIDEKVDFFEERIQFIFNLHAPFRTYRVSKPRAPWLTDDLRLMMRERDGAFRKFKISNSDEDWLKYKRLRNNVLYVVRQKKKLYTTQRFTLGAEEGWRALAHMGVLNNKRRDTSNIDLCENSLNDYFSNLLNTPHDCKNVVDHYKAIPRFCDARFEFTTVSIGEVESMFYSIKSRECGRDYISPQMLSFCFPHLLPQVCHIINSCLEAGVFPESWREAVVRPIPKKEHPTSPADLRPISILPVLSKILEKIIHKQLTDYLNLNEILPSCQSGFRRNHSTVTALLKITDDILRATDRGQITTLVLLDLSRAFDTVDHDVLLAKLQHVGLSDVPLAFFKSYLRGRRQRVMCSGNISGSLPITTGVPQGSVLGPLLFLVYIFDLFKIVNHCSIHGYADDIQLYYSFNPGESSYADHCLNRDLDVIYQFAAAHNLKLNSGKSSFTLFGRSQGLNEVLRSDFCPIINGEAISHAAVVRNLGLMMDCDLRFADHVSLLLRRSYSRLRLLYANRHILNFELRKMLSISIVLSVFQHGNVVYGPCLDKVTEKRVQQVQRICGRFVFGLRKFDSVSQHLRTLGWLPMSKVWEMHLLTMTHSIIKTNAPEYLREKISYRSDIHGVQVRSRNTLSIPKYRTSIFRRSFTYMSVKLYNGLNDGIRDSSISAFRRKVRALFLARFHE